MNEERLARLCVASFPGFGSRSLRKLGSLFSSWSSVWSADRAALLRSGVVESVINRFLEWRRTQDPATLVGELVREQIRVVFPDEVEFPRLLAASADPPEILFVRGILTEAPAIALVGTRRMTDYGKRCVEIILPELVRAGLAIVSGLALGVDGQVHTTTLDHNGTTVAILGTGLDEASLYPRDHVHLAHRILDHGGALLSEFPPRTVGFKGNFPMRNRLIASFSLATIVVEAAQDSGSLITAKLALEENREVLAVPGPIWSEQSVGANHLLKLGAKPCTSAADVLAALSLDRPDLMAQARALLPLDPQEELLLRSLEEPCHIDELARLAEQPIVTVSSQLSVLELKGYVKRLGGQMWIRSIKQP